MSAVFLFFLISGLLIYVVRVGVRVSRLEADLNATKGQLRELKQQWAAKEKAGAADRELEPEAVMKPIEVDAPVAPESEVIWEMDVSADSGAEPLMGTEVQTDQDSVSVEKKSTPPPLPPRVVEAAVDREKEVAESLPSASTSPMTPTESAIDWRAILQKLYLLPPTDDDAAEATVVAWWATRIGLILLIIAATFFGIHVASDVSPWVRTGVLTAISAAVIGLGVFLEKRIPAFGRLISAGGLGLTYFTAFAAFALEPTKVISAPLVGLLVQALAVAFIIGWSVWRRTQIAATMAILLGYVSCWFSYVHDQQHFVIAGFIILGLGAAFLLWRQRWLWPQAFAIPGSWIGFVILGQMEWTAPDAAPAFGFILACLLGLFLIFEAAHFLLLRSADEAETRWINWFTVGSSSLSILAGWVSVLSAHPDRVEWFFLAFFIVMLAAAVVHAMFGERKRFAVMFFLKSMGLLAMFFVEAFSGPTRWLSMSLQCGAVLWAYVRTQYRWVELGFVAMCVATFGVLLSGAWSHLDTEWALWSLHNVIGGLALVIMVVWLAIHQQRTGGSASEQARNSRCFFHLISAAAVAVIALVLGAGDFLMADRLGRIGFLAGLSVLLVVPVWWWRRFVPVLAGSLTLVGAAVLWGVADAIRADQSAYLVLGGVLVVFSFAATELARRFWQSGWKAGHVYRLILSLCGMALVVGIAVRLIDDHRVLGYGRHLLIIAAAIVASAAMARLSGWSGAVARPEGRVTQWVYSGVAGAAIAALAGVYLHGSAWVLVSLLVIAGIFALSAVITRSAVPSVAALIATGTGLVCHVERYDQAINLGGHAAVVAVAIFILIGIAAGIWWFGRGSQRAEVRAFQMVAIGVAMFAAHWWFHSHFVLSQVFLFDALVALGALAISRVVPLRGLATISVVPFVLALLLFIGRWLDGATEVATSHIIYWIIGGGVAFAWLLLRHTMSDRESGEGAGWVWNTVLATLAITLAAHEGFGQPWNLVALAATGLVLISIGRWRGVAGAQYLGLVPLGIAVAFSLFDTTVGGSSDTVLLHTSYLVAGILAAAGVVFARIGAAHRRWAAFFGGVALLLAFIVFAPGKLGVDKLTTVLWGIASVVVFGMGLAGKLRSYRIIGLSGLGICIVRMFIYDIDDTLYRIFAFMGIALVLLGVGYLYHRFRDKLDWE